MDDLILTDNDLTIKNNDFKVGESTAQEIEIILKAHKGNFYQHPLIGVGLDDELNAASNKEDLSREIRLNLESDNIRVDDLILEGGIDSIEGTINGERLK